MTIIFDLDDTLNNHIHALIKWHNDIYNSKLKLSDFETYYFWEVWGGTKGEAKKKYYKFQDSNYAWNLEAFDGAVEVINYFHQKGHDMEIVTARQNDFKKQTYDFFDRVFSGMFKNIQFGNQYSRNGSLNFSKSNLVKNIRDPTHFFDDSPQNILECSNKIPGLKLCIFSPPDYLWTKSTNNIPSDVTYVDSFQSIKNVIDEDLC